jgi:hypothetical protein
MRLSSLCVATVSLLSSLTFAHLTFAQHSSGGGGGSSGQFEWRRFIRRIQFFKQFRRQPQFQRFQFERSQFKWIEFAWIERARFDIILFPLQLFPLQRKYVSFE